MSEFMGLSSEQVQFIFTAIRSQYGHFSDHRNSELAQLEGKLSIVGEVAHTIGNHTKPIVCQTINERRAAPKKKTARAKR